MILSALVEVLEQVAPTRLAEGWDNVGLLVGDPAHAVQTVLLTVDYTPEVAAEARRLGCQAVVAYHPPLFPTSQEPVKRLGPDSLIYDAIAHNIALYSPHTAADVCRGGTNDLLGDVVGMTARAPLRASNLKPREVKLVTFVPEDALERVSMALFEAGAGRIGQYKWCSFRTPGTGTFFGETGTAPAVGQAGRLEQVPELKLETVVPLSKVDAVVRALRLAHPYEEPAFDLIPLSVAAEGLGLGRVGPIEPTDRAALLARIKAGLGLSHVLVAGPLVGEVRTVAVGAGACGDLINDALKARADLYLTGEVRHHDALKAARAGMTVVCTLHSNSERAWLARLRTRLLDALPEIEVHLSQADRDPFEVG